MCLLVWWLVFFFFFFFQAEDGIRDVAVTGVQTCALPIYRAVGTAEEPLRVLGDPRVVGRALDREVERHLEAEAARALDEPVEVVEGAELRVDRRVAALREIGRASCRERV